MHQYHTARAWPYGRRFAFTVIDDTDGATVAGVAPFYRLLTELGIWATKTVWPLPPEPGHAWKGGDSLADPAYREWVLRLQTEGHEIAFHGATDHSSRRETTLRALNRHREILGADPVVHVTHMSQREGLYWGQHRVDGAARAVFGAIQTMRHRRRPSEGHVPTSPYFWGDICSDRIRYVRNLVFRPVDTLASDPTMPYHDPTRPYVPCWFSASEGANASSFCQLLSEANQDLLVNRGGCCIAYTHTAYGFVQDGTVHPRVQSLLLRLAGLGGWYAPVSEILDHLRAERGGSVQMDRNQWRRMQARWLATKVLHGTS